MKKTIDMFINPITWSEAWVGYFRLNHETQKWGMVESYIIHIQSPN